MSKTQWNMIIIMPFDHFLRFEPKRATFERFHIFTELHGRANFKNENIAPNESIESKCEKLDEI